METDGAGAWGEDLDIERAEQRRHLRRILIGFFSIVVLLPLAGLGGAWSWLLLVLLVIAALSLREAIALRRSVLRAAAPPEP